MTMHLEQGLTLLNTSRKKPKRSIGKNKMAEYEKRMREYNKHMRQIQMHDHQMTLEEFIDYCHGCYKSKTNVDNNTDKEYKFNDNTVYRRESPQVPSHSDSKVVANVKGIDWQEQKERLEISKQYTIAPAYNKGPYMVVSRSDVKTAGRKI